MDESPGRSASALHIQRLRSEYLVAPDHPFPEGLRSELDEAVRNSFEDLCAQALEPLFPPADESVWLIRQLDLDLALNSIRVDGIARPLAVQFGRSLHRILNEGERYGEVVRFPSRVAFLSHFVADLVQGSAWDKWWYCNFFDSLRSLPTEIAIREALVRDPSFTEAALYSLRQEDRLESVLAQLSWVSVSRIVQSCAASVGTTSSSTSGRQMLAAILSAWPEAGLASTSRPADFLRLYLVTRERSPTISAAALCEALDHLFALADFVRSEASAYALNSMQRGNFNEAIETAARSSQPKAVTALRYFTQAVEGDAALMARTIAVMESSGGPRPLAQSATRRTSHSLESCCGGAFLLLRAMMESGICRLIQSISSDVPERIDAAGMLRWLVLLKCLGNDHALRNAADAALALLAGLDDPPTSHSWETIRMIGYSPNGQSQWLSFVMVLAERERIEARCWLAELVIHSPTERARTIVIRDLTSDEWLFGGLIASDATGATADALGDALEFLQTYCRLSAEFIILDSRLSREIETHGFRAWQKHSEIGVSSLKYAVGLQSDDFIERNFTIWNQNKPEVPSEEYGRWSHQLSRFVPAAVDLDFLRLGHLNLFRDLYLQEDLFWSVAARTVLKDFSRRLIGFDYSSAGFLQSNFLEAPASIRIYPRINEADEVCVRLVRPPLHLVLSMAGADGETLAIPWLGGAQVSPEFLFS
jgi:hypothetical protein